jgi:DNA-binding transcriptional MerR regulator
MTTADWEGTNSDESSDAPPPPATHTPPEQVSVAIDAFNAMAPSSTPSIPDRLYFRIGDVADLVGVKPYVLRYWETEFPMISPQKSASGQRVYRKSDVDTVLLIKHLLYEERYSIDGARKRLRELRKDGVLKAFKAETLGQKSAPAQAAAGATAEAAPHAASSALSSSMSREVIESIIALARELKTLADSPINSH